MVQPMDLESGGTGGFYWISCMECNISISSYGYVAVKSGQGGGRGVASWPMRAETLCHCQRSED